MSHTPSQGPRENAGELLRRALAEVEHRYQTTGSARIGDLLRPLGARSGALGAALLALPFLSPVSLGPVTAPASAAIALLGIHLLRAREGAPLPERIQRVTLPRAVYRAMGAALERVSRWTGRARDARRTRWVRGDLGRRVCVAGVLAGALLLAVPIPLLPLTNTLPALSILLFVLGWANQDARLTAYGTGALAAFVAVIAAVGIGVATVGMAAVRQFMTFW